MMVIQNFCPLIKDNCKDNICMFYLANNDDCAIPRIFEMLQDLDGTLASFEESIGNLLGK